LSSSAGTTFNILDGLLHLFIFISIAFKFVGVLPHLFEFVSGEFSDPTFTLELGQVLANFGIARDQIVILENTMWVLQDQLLQI